MRPDIAARRLDPSYWLASSVVVLDEDGVWFGMVRKVEPEGCDLLLHVAVTQYHRNDPALILSYVSNGTVWRSSSLS